MPTKQKRYRTDLPSKEDRIQHAVTLMIVHITGMAVTSKGADALETATAIRDELSKKRGYRKLPGVVTLAKLLQQTQEYAALEAAGRLRWQIATSKPPLPIPVDWETRVSSCCQRFAFPRELFGPLRNEFVCLCCGQIELRFRTEKLAGEYFGVGSYGVKLWANIVVTTQGRACQHRKEKG